MAQLHRVTIKIEIYEYFPENLHLWDTVDVGDDSDDVIERQQRVAFQLSVDVLALCAGSQELHQGVVIGQSSILICPLSLTAHHLQQHWEGGAVVVEHQHVLPAVHQLNTKITGS